MVQEHAYYVLSDHVAERLVLVHLGFELLDYIVMLSENYPTFFSSFLNSPHVFRYSAIALKSAAMPGVKPSCG